MIGTVTTPGRARNARPRDGLGRPLPYGAIGGRTGRQRARPHPRGDGSGRPELLDAGRPFHAHEVYEDAWRKCSAAQPRLDQIGDVTSLLLGRWRDAGDRAAIGTVDRHGIAECKDSGSPGR